MAAKKDGPLVSVIIPVYNGADFIGESIDSALQQSYGNLEVIVVDDGSTDGTLAILNGYAANDHRVRVLSQPNAGVSAFSRQATIDNRKRASRGSSHAAP